MLDLPFPVSSLNLLVGVRYLVERAVAFRRGVVMLSLSGAGPLSPLRDMNHCLQPSVLDTPSGTLIRSAAAQWICVGGHI